MDWSKYLFTMEYDAYHGDGSVIHRLGYFSTNDLCINAVGTRKAMATNSLLLARKLWMRKDLSAG